MFLYASFAPFRPFRTLFSLAYWRYAFLQRFVYCPQLGPCDVAIDAYTTNVDTMPRERVGYDLGLVRSIIRVPQWTPSKRWTHVNKMCVIFIYNFR